MVLDIRCSYGNYFACRAVREALDGPGRLKDSCQSPPEMGITITNWFWPFAGYQTSADVEAGCTAPSTYLAP